MRKKGDTEGIKVMKQLVGTELLEYLQNAITVETDIVTQEKIADEYKANALQRKPILNVKDLPIKPQQPYTIFDFDVTDNSNPSYGVSILRMIGWLFVGFGIIVFAALQGDAAALGLVAVLCLIGWGMTIPYSLKKKEVEKENELKAASYAKSLEHYNLMVEEITNQNADDKKRYATNIIAWESSNREFEERSRHFTKESQATLDKLYSWDVIYPKYRNLPALTRIYEYLITERCEGLTGPHGAYNLYEDEVRKDMIISQLFVVIENLEQIKQNQYLLYQQVKEIQQTTSSIESELRQIKGHTVQIASLTALNAYYAALTERNTRITMWCNI